MISAQAPRQSTRTLFALAGSMALQVTGFVMIQPLFARRFESFGAGVEALGMSAMAYALASIVTAPLAGLLADRFGRRPVILLSLAANVVAFGGYLFATAVWQLIVLRGLAGVFTAGLVPAITSSVGDLAPERRRAQWIGIVNGGASLGWIVGPVLGGQFYDSFGYLTPFAVATTMAIAALAVGMFLIPETERGVSQSGPSRAGWAPTFRALPISPDFLVLMFISLGVMFVWAFIEPQLMFYAYDSLRWTTAQLGFVMSTYGLACAIGEFSLGRLSDRLGRKPVLIVGLLLFSAQFIGLVLFQALPGIVVSFILAGLGNAIFDPALCALVLDISPPGQSARFMGVKATVGSLGSLLGPALVVLLAPAIGPRMVFLISAAMVLVLAVASRFVVRKSAVASVAH